MDFSTIDTRRERAGLTRAELCREAAVHPTTYLRLSTGVSGGRVDTLDRLAQALDRLASEAGAAAP